jgi:hypothetical protein
MAAIITSSGSTENQKGIFFPVSCMYVPPFKVAVGLTIARLMPRY